jgi:hypothetical protein
MSLEQLIEALKKIHAVHPNADVRLLLTNERGEREIEIHAVEYFSLGKVALLTP